MSIQQTSLEAYINIAKELGQRQLQVYRILCKIQPATNCMLSQACMLPINQVTPRIHELRQMGLVTEEKKANCKITGRTAIYWRVK